jgi:hypothetical protein
VANFTTVGSNTVLVLQQRESWLCQGMVTALQQEPAQPDAKRAVASGPVTPYQNACFDVAPCIHLVTPSTSTVELSADSVLTVTVLTQC